MDLPIIDILGQAQAANQLPETMGLTDREQWIDEVEFYAPGYLAQKAEGHGGEYPLHRLTVPGSVEQVRKRVIDRIRSRPDSGFILFHPTLP